MKNLIIYLFSITFPLAIFAQGNSTPPPITDVVFDQQFQYRVHPQIRGKVLHASPSDLEDITIKYSVVNVGNPFQTCYNTKLAPDGTFRILMPEKLQLRIGGGYIATPVSKDYVYPETPDNNRVLIAGGFTYKMNQKFDLTGSFAYQRILPREANNVDSHLSGTYTTNIYAPGIGLTYKF